MAMAFTTTTDDNNNIPSPLSSQSEQSNHQLEEQQNQNQPPTSTQQQNKRKPSRRANTAERRATHNAVERQRRETLNGRFLDLAALLPNLSQIRRPSKSSIVNSSIAHVHASRRHRLLAARELRLLKQEADALRRELNEWRDRAQIPRIDEPVRSDGFSMVLSAELEVIAAVPGDGDDEDGYDGEGGNDGGYGGAYMDDIEEEQYAVPAQQQQHPSVQVEMDDPRVAALLKNANPFAHTVPPTSNGLAHGLPMVAPYDNPMALYEQQAHQQHSTYPNQAPFLHDHQEKMQWNNMYHHHQQQQQMMHQQVIQGQRHSNRNGTHSLPSPPHSSGSGSVSPPHHTSSSIPPASTAYAGDAAAWTSQSVSLQRRRSSGSSSGYAGSYVESPVYAGSPTGYAGSSSGYGGSYTGSPPGSNAGDSPAYELALAQADYGVAVPRRGGYPGVEMGVGMQQQQAVVAGMMM